LGGVINPHSLRSGDFSTVQFQLALLLELAFHKKREEKVDARSPSLLIIAISLANAEKL
jgi:hypothetical protein